MIRNYFITAFRNLMRNKSYTWINVLGLAVGMAVFLLIDQYVRFERSYEDFIPDRSNIYRASLKSFRNNETIAASAEGHVGISLHNDILSLPAERQKSFKVISICPTPSYNRPAYL